MALSLFMNHSINMTYKRIYDWPLQEEESAGSEQLAEPHLILRLRSDVDVEGQIMSTLVESRHRFNDCTSSFLSSYIKEKEPLPLDCVMDHEFAEMTRDWISEDIAYLARSCVGDAGLKRLQVDVISKIFEEQVGENHMEDRDEEVENETEIRRERRMALLQKNVCMEEGISGSSSTLMADEHVCTVCLEEMVKGAKEVVCTPCGHLFHARCIGQWFEKSGFCPLCRFDFGA